MRSIWSSSGKKKKKEKGQKIQVDVHMEPQILSSINSYKVKNKRDDNVLKQKEKVSITSCNSTTKRKKKREKYGGADVWEMQTASVLQKSSVLDHSSVSRRQFNVKCCSSNINKKITQFITDPLTAAMRGNRDRGTKRKPKIEPIIPQPER